MLNDHLVMIYEYELFHHWATPGGVSVPESINVMCSICFLFGSDSTYAWILNSKYKEVCGSDEQPFYMVI